MYSHSFQHYIVIEFAEEPDLKNVFNVSTYTDEDSGLPTHSHFLWFRAANRKMPKLKQSKNAVLNIKNGTKSITETELKELLLGCTDVSLFEI